MSRLLHQGRGSVGFLALTAIQGLLKQIGRAPLAARLFLLGFGRFGDEPLVKVILGLYNRSPKPIRLDLYSHPGLSLAWSVDGQALGPDGPWMGVSYALARETFVLQAHQVLLLGPAGFPCPPPGVLSPPQQQNIRSRVIFSLHSSMSHRPGCSVQRANGVSGLRRSTSLM